MKWSVCDFLFIGDSIIGSGNLGFIYLVSVLGLGVY